MIPQGDPSRPVPCLPKAISAACTGIGGAWMTIGHYGGVFAVGEDWGGYPPSQKIFCRSPHWQGERVVPLIIDVYGQYKDRLVWVALCPYHSIELLICVDFATNSTFYRINDRKTGIVLIFTKNTSAPQQAYLHLYLFYYTYFYIWIIAARSAKIKSNSTKNIDKRKIFSLQNTPKGKNAKT